MRVHYIGRLLVPATDDDGHRIGGSMIRGGDARRLVCGMPWRFRDGLPVSRLRTVRKRAVTCRRCRAVIRAAAKWERRVEASRCFFHGGVT